MIALYYNKNTGFQQKKKYPSKQNKELVGLSEEIEWYELSYSEKPSYDSRQYNCIENIDLTKTKGGFLNIAKCTYTLEEKDPQEVIGFLNESLGNHLDTHYLPMTRTKHLHEAVYYQVIVGGDNLTEDQISRYEYIKSLGAWLARNRALRDAYESTYLTTGKLPTIEWEAFDF